MEKIKIKDESGDKKYFTIIPNYILNHSTLWDREVYIQMKRITGEDGTCWTSQNTLSKQCGMSINRLKKSLNYLVEHKWITQIGKKEVFTKGGVQEVNEYKVADLWKMNIEFYEEQGVSLDDTPIPKGVSPLKPKGCHENTKGVSPDDDKEEPFKQEPLVRRTSKANALQGKDWNNLIDGFKEINPLYKEFYKNNTERAALEVMAKNIGYDKLLATIQALPEITSRKFAPKITKPSELKRDFGKLLMFYKQELSTNNIIL